MLQYYLPFTGYPYHGETVACPVCRSGRRSPISRFDRRLKLLPTVMCDDCGLFFTNPMPTEAELDAYYRTQYRLDYQFALGRPGQRHMRKKQREAERRHATLAPFLPEAGARLLDFGCGSGELVRHFAARGHSATGLEPGADYARHAMETAPEKGAFRIDNAPWREAAYPEGAFDVVTMLHVLEHLPDPVAALAAAHRWLAPEGLLLVEVPNMQGYALKCFERFHFAHVLGFSRDNLIHAARLASFEPAREFEPTSILFAKAGRGPREAAIDLEATAARNRAEYAKPIALAAYLKHHSRRLARRLSRA